MFGLSRHIGYSHKEYSRERYYLEFVNPDSGRCLACDAKTSFRSLGDGFFFYCSPMCSRNSYDVKLKTKLSNQKRYGVDNVFASEMIKDRIKETLQKKYGVKHIMQNPEFLLKAKKTAFKIKEVLIEGRKFFVQGYEDRFLKECTNDCEIEIKDISDTVPVFDYDEGKHQYFPDFFIPAKNLIVEIKSSWTAYGTQGFKDQLEKKIDAVLKAGYDFLLVVYSGDDRKGNKKLTKKIFYFKNESGRKE